MTTPDDPLLTPQDADGLLRVTRGTTARLARQGALPAVLLPWTGVRRRPERTIRFRKAELLEHLAQADRLVEENRLLEERRARLSAELLSERRKVEELRAEVERLRTGIERTRKDLKEAGFEEVIAPKDDTIGEVVDASYEVEEPEEPDQ